MTTKQYKNEINFVKQEIVSVSEKEKRKKVEMVSFIFAILTLVFVIISSVFKIYTISELTKVKEIQATLISQIQAPEQKQKEELFFLIKNRLVKIKEIESSRVKLNSFVKIFKDMKVLLSVEDFSLNLNAAKVTMATDDYDRFDDFIARLDEFFIEEKSMIVDSVSQVDSKFTIHTKFNFKRI